MSFSQKYARENQLLEQHLREVGMECSRRGEKVNMPLTGRLLGLIHDLGKASEDFQQYLESQKSDHAKKRGSVDHSTAGAQFLWNHFKPEKGELRFLRQMIAACGASHHNGGLVNFLNPDGVNAFKKRLEKSSAESHYEEVMQLLPPALKEELEALISSPILAEEMRCFDQKTNLLENEMIMAFYHGMQSRFLLSCLIAGDQISAAGDFPQKTSVPDWDLYLSRLNEHIKTFDNRGDINGLRATISDACLNAADREQGQYLLTLPTGGGKTLASLRFALAHAKKHQLDRIIYVIPYTSIIEQNADSARTALADTAKDIILEHHSNFLPDKELNDAKETDNTSKSEKKEEADEKTIKETDAYRKAVEGWNAPIIFTTSVQFLNALFASGAGHVRRLNSLARSVIIFDEIQTLPLKTAHMFNNAVNYLFQFAQTTTVFCTATQPILDKLDHTKKTDGEEETEEEKKEKKGALKLSDHPHLVPEYRSCFEQFSAQRKITFHAQIKDQGWSLEELSSLAKEQADKHGSVLFIVNTRSLARKLFSQCNEEGYEVHHLSTNMCPAHRFSIIEGEISKKALLAKKEVGKKVICVTTQLIEAGVDVDFDVVIRSSAGMDSVIQAAGRCNRDRKSGSGFVLLVNPSPELEKLDTLKTIKTGKEITERVLREYDQEPEYYDDDPLGEKILTRYFELFFEIYKDELSYKATVDMLPTTLLDLLSLNIKSYGATNKEYTAEQNDYPLRQSSQSANEAFLVIDQDTVGVLVPYGRGKDIITELSNLKYPDNEEDWVKIKVLLREAQRYSISFFRNKLAGYFSKGYLGQISNMFDILHLHPEYYHSHLGVCDEGDELQKTNSEVYHSC